MIDSSRQSTHRTACKFEWRSNDERRRLNIDFGIMMYASTLKCLTGNRPNEQCEAS